MKSAYIKTALIKVAQHLPGISTPHYLYFSGTVNAINMAKKGRDAMEQIDALPDHNLYLRESDITTAALDDCALARLSQSSSYSCFLDKNPAIVDKLFAILEELSGQKRPAQLALGLSSEEQANIYDPASIDITSMLGQWDSATKLYLQYLNPGSAPSIQTAIMDSVLPIAHWLVSSMMLFDRLEEQMLADKPLREDLTAVIKRLGFDSTAPAEPKHPVANQWHNLTNKSVSTLEAAFKDSFRRIEQPIDETLGSHFIALDSALSALLNRVMNPDVTTLDLFSLTAKVLHRQSRPFLKQFGLKRPRILKLTP